VRLETLITRFLGETASKLKLIFDAVERTRAVYLFDEFDSIGIARGSENDVGEMRRVLNSFLVFIKPAWQQRDNSSHEPWAFCSIEHCFGVLTTVELGMPTWS
jgi:SpoVK/Ycf46/Vps4 family AAA+-type ATPase